MSSNSSMANSTGGGTAGQEQQLQQAQNFTVQTFAASLIVSFAVFGVEVAVFILIKQKLPRIYRPRTYLVPEKERVNAPPTGIWRWALPVFHTSNSEFIQKCGLDAYFFLRFLRMLLKIFVPMAFVIMPILIPINAVGGRDQDFIHEAPFNKNPGNWTVDQTVVGLNQLAWGNVRPTNPGRYWVHLVLALAVIVYCLYVFYDELRGYIRLRQAFLTSPQHRIRASATTVLVSAIPRKWCTVEALDGLYDVFPGGIRNIWINRNFNTLSDKVKDRNKIALKLESAQTNLIQNAKKKQVDQAKKEAKKSGQKQTKAEAAVAKKQRDEDAAQMAEQPAGGDPPETNGSVHEKKGVLPIPIVGEGLGAVGQGIGRLGKTVLGGLRSVGNEVNDQINTTQGFQMPDEADREPLSPTQNDGVGDGVGPGYHIPGSTSRPPYARTDSQTSSIKPTQAPERPINGIRSPDPPAAEPSKEEPESPNPTYGAPTIDDRINRKSSISGRPNVSANGKDLAKAKPGILTGFVKSDQQELMALPSPVPKGHNENGYFNDKEAKSVVAKVQFWKKEKEPEEPYEYPDAYDKEYDSVKDGEPLWKKYLKPSDRETMRLPIKGIKGLGWIPFVGQKVDKIDHCRKELARLNLEIEEDQKEPEKFPLMNSAFIQFNHQVAAHMACQSVSHHVPSQMAPRIVEISPGDVVWDNLSVQWWERYVRTAVVIVVVIGLVMAWTFPVAFTGLLANIKYISTQYEWLSWLDKIPSQLISPIQGVLPQLLLAILLALLPIVLRFLTRLQGFSTGMSIELNMADYYFFFLFVQVFLVVTIASGATNIFAVASQLGANPQTIPAQLAATIPRASNYYFSYLILQAMSTSAGQLVQIGALFVWFILAPLLDSTARAKWKRQLSLPNMQWGSFFPIYTNLACIGLIYCVVAPFILVFNILTFTLFWFVFRYNTLYVTKFQFDTGGLLFPKAINHMFTGLYVMEILLIGLFFLVTGVDENGNPTGTAAIPQAIIMIVALILTVVFQFLLNHTFGPLIRYLPITLEDEASARDDEFARTQEKRFNLVEDERAGDDINDLLEAREEREFAADDEAEAIELQQIADRRTDRHRLDPRSLAQSAGDRLTAVAPSAVTGWASRTRQSGSAWLYSPKEAQDGNARADDLIRAHRLRQRTGHGADAEVAAAAPGAKGPEPAARQGTSIGDALFAGISDEIEDLTPEDRDLLVRRAFQHEALRARKPVVWIPRDDLGVSDDEVKRTRKFSAHVWISNEHTGLDSKARVVYRKSPPDFSEVDLIEL